MAKSVLIVEDNELNMKLFRDLLEAHGLETIETNDGHKVLNLAKEHNPDLILMDIQLPEISGLEVTKWLKEDESLQDIPVIAVTAFAMKGDEKKIREGGCEDYISKPIAVTQFIEVIEKYIGGIESSHTSLVSEQYQDKGQDQSQDKDKDQGKTENTKANSEGGDADQKNSADNELDNELDVDLSTELDSQEETQQSQEQKRG